MGIRGTFLRMLGAGAGAAAVPGVAAAQTANLRIGAPFADSFGGPFYVKDAGAFARDGFNVDVSIIPAGAAVVAALAGGGIDLGVADVVSSAQAFSKGIPIELLAACGLYVASEPLAALYVAKDSPIRQPRDLEGRTLAVPQLAGLTTAAVRAWLAQNRVDISKIRIVEVPSPSAPAAIIRGTVDASVLGEPFITPVKNDIRDIGHPLDAIANVYVLSAWFALRSWIDANRARARLLVSAIYETQRWANTHVADTAAILVRDGKMDPDTVRGMTRTRFASSSAGLLAQVVPVLKAGVQYKLIDSTVDPSAYIARL